jgi:hypothetical protein
MRMAALRVACALVIGASFCSAADGLLWSNSGWKGITAVDMANDTIYAVLSRPPSATGIAVSQGNVFVAFADGYVVRISAGTRQAVDSVQACPDTGTPGLLAADSGAVWMVDVKPGRPTRLARLNASPLQAVSTDAIQTDSCTVYAMAALAGEAWLYHTNPPSLLRASHSGGAFSVIDLSTYVQGKVRLCLNGRTGWVLSDSSVLVKVNLDTRSVVASYDLKAALGTKLAIAVCSAGMFVSPMGVTPAVISRLGDVPTTVSGSWQYDSSTTMFLRSAGSRVIAVVSKGWYNQYEEIDPAGMTLKHQVGETYCYDMAIDEPAPALARPRGLRAEPSGSNRSALVSSARYRLDGRRVGGRSNANVAGLVILAGSTGRVATTVVQE